MVTAGLNQAWRVTQSRKLDGAIRTDGLTGHNIAITSITRTQGGGGKRVGFTPAMTSSNHLLHPFIFPTDTDVALELACGRQGGCL